jgi:hypothetical protein
MWLLPALLCGLVSCRDATDYTNNGDHYEGAIAGGSFVRAGFASTVRACLTLDGSRMQEAPGTLQLSDGSIVTSTPLRPVPQTFHDPIATLRFGTDREQNYLYVASMKDGTDITVVLSLLTGGGVELRLMRGAPGSKPEPLFGLFPLKKEPGACSF